MSFQDFKRMELAVGEVKAAADHPRADKLMLLQVDLGAAGVRQVVAGIRGCYSAEQLVGRQVVVVVNLAPAVLRGEKSEGMILAAEGPGGAPVLLAPDSKVSPGAKVR
jgi:methionyl-tRNA synthetase